MMEIQSSILERYFDMHQRPIVYLIHKIQLSTTGKMMALNELRLKYQYHTCPIRIKPRLFFKLHDILYSRVFGFNRYTLILCELRFKTIIFYESESSNFSHW